MDKFREKNEWSRLELVLPTDMKQELNKICKEKEIKMSKLVRSLIEKYISDLK